MVKKRINKFIYKLNNYKIRNYSSTNKSRFNGKKGVSILTVTNNNIYIDNIIENYNNQDFEPKELIIILNNNNLNLNEFKTKIKISKNIRVYKVDERVSLGECINYGINKSKYDIIAKFDDDDYYAPKYISDSIKAFDYTEAELIGKRSHLIYFEESKILAIRNPNHENCYDVFVNGSTMIFKKEIIKKVKFANISIAEDTRFCNDCVKRGIKIYSTSRYNHVYIRHISKNNHTWKISDEKLLKNSCKVIGKVDNYKLYAINSHN